MTLDEDLSGTYSREYYGGSRGVRSLPRKPSPIELIGTGSALHNSQTGKYSLRRAGVQLVAKAIGYVADPFTEFSWSARSSSPKRNWFAEKYWQSK
ncbi:hypothetical protein HOC01_04855 [archaeon]|jgi:hypothetical protein|nr:hypothetical protein [archaeon]MBT6698297.1 hypothetical protein [archaeon]